MKRIVDGPVPHGKCGLHLYCKPLSDGEKKRSSQLSNSKVCESKIMTHTGPVYDCFLYIMPFVLGMYSNSKTALSPSFNIKKVATREPRNILVLELWLKVEMDVVSLSLV